MINSILNNLHNVGYSLLNIDNNLRDFGNLTDIVEKLRDTIAFSDDYLSRCSKPRTIPNGKLKNGFYLVDDDCINTNIYYHKSGTWYKVNIDSNF